MEHEPSDRLNSWREIAAFIARDERTAMRWAKLLGMPVHHAPGGSHARVYAYRSEIMVWMAAEPRTSNSAKPAEEHRSLVVPAAGPSDPHHPLSHPVLARHDFVSEYRSFFSRIWSRIWHANQHP